MSFLEQIEREVESGYINVAKHPTKPLTTTSPRPHYQAPQTKSTMI